MTTLRSLIAFLCAVAVLAAGPSVAQAPGQIPDELAGVGVEEQLGGTVSPEIAFLDADGTPVTLGDYLDGERPVVLAFVYHSCPMLCSLILDGMTRALREVSLGLGDDYQALAVSFDPRDTPERAAAAKERYLARFDGDAAAGGLHFLTGTQESIDRLTAEVGFGFEWNERQQEFAHTGALIFLSPEGTVTRYLYGIEFPQRDVRTALLEAANGRIGSPMDQLILYCFRYDPNAGSYVLHAVNAMKVGGLLTMLLLGGVLFLFWRRERARLDAALGPADRALSTP